MTDLAVARDAQPVPALSIGNILTRSLQLFRRHFGAFLLVSAILTLPDLIWSLFQADLNPVRGASQATITPAGGQSAANLISAFIQTAVQTVIVYATFADLQGRPVDLMIAVRRGLARFFPALRTAFMQGIGILVGLLFLIIPGLIAMAVFSISVPVSVLEEKRAVDSVNRSAALTRGNRWKILGTMIAAYSAGFTVLVIVIIPFELAGGRLSSAVGEYLGLVLFNILTSIVPAIIYFDLRVAKEGLGSDRLVEVFS